MTVVEEELGANAAVGRKRRFTPTIALFSTKPNAATRALQQLGLEPRLLYNEIVLGCFSGKGKILSDGTHPAEPISQPQPISRANNRAAEA